MTALSSPFESKSFRYLFSAQITSLIGSGFTQVALALLAFDMVGLGAAAVLGIAWSMRVIASVTIAPIVGGLVHKLPRKTWLIGLDIGRAALLLLLPFIETTTQLYLLIFLVNALSAGFTPVFQALLPDVLTNEDTYTRALSHSRLAFELERILSPALAGIALLVLSYNALFVFNALCFMVSAFLLWITPFPKAATNERSQGVWHNISYGIKGYLRTPRLQGLLALQLSVAATGSMVIINTVGYVQGNLGLSEQATVWMMAVVGLGAIIAARLTPYVLENYCSDRQLSLLAGWIMCFTLLPLAFVQPNLLLLAISWFFIGLGSSFVLTTAGRVITRSCSQSDRSAFFAANFSLSHAMWLLCYPLAGWWGTHDFTQAALGLMILTVIGAGLANWLWKKSDSEALTHHHPEMNHEHQHYHDEHHQHSHEGWEGAEPHTHSHHHPEMHHRHKFVIDEHHAYWPK